MRWPLTFASRRDIVAVVLGVVICAGFLFVVIRSSGWWPPSNLGFGPDWDCTRVGKGDPVCVKRPPAHPAGAIAPAR